MKYCKNCGTQMEDDSAFCASCGTPVTQTPQVQPPQEPQAYAPQQSFAPQPPKKRPKTGLIIGIIAAVVVIAAAAVCAVLFLMPGDPMHQFGGGMTGFFSSFDKLPSNEVATRMKTESYDVSLNTNLSDLMSQVAPGQDTGMPDNLTLKADLKNTGKDGGLLVSISSGDTALFKVIGIVTDDKLIAGYSSAMTGDSTMKSAALALKGKPGDPLASRLADVTSGNQDLAKDIGTKFLKYAGESVDPKWFTTEDSSVKDALSGEPVKTRAAVMTLDADKTIQLLKTLSGKLDADPTFYSDMDKLQSSGGVTGADSKTQYDQMFTEAEKGLEGQDFKLKAMVHYSGITPVAVEITADLKGDNAFTMDMTLQKATKGNSTAYLLSLNAQPQDSSQAVDMTLSLNVDKTSSGYSFDGKVNMKSTGETLGFGLKGTADIEKKSSNEYTIATKATVNWDIPDSTPGSVNASLDEDVAFGAAVKSVQSDSDYMYDDLSSNAKEVSTLEDFIQALTGLNGLSSFGY